MNLPLTVNVVINNGSQFDYKKFMNSDPNYTMHVLAGQHITTCDAELLNTKYLNTAVALIPKAILFKQVELFVNLTHEEETLLVQLNNDQLIYKNQYIDKVLHLNLYCLYVCWCYSI